MMIDYLDNEFTSPVPFVVIERVCKQWTKLLRLAELISYEFFILFLVIYFSILRCSSMLYDDDDE